MASRPAKRNCVSYGPESVNSLGETDVDQDVFSFLWTINNYSTMVELGRVNSPMFHGGPKNNFSWRLKLYRCKEDHDYISVYVVLVDNGNLGNEDKMVKANFQLAILNADGRPVIQNGGLGTKIRKFRKANMQSGYIKFCRSAEILNPRSKLVVDGAVKILCKMWIFGETKLTLRNGGGEKRVKLSNDGFAKDLGKLFKESIGTDVTISGSKTSFKAHKAILMARSPVFAAMFNNDMLEKQVNLVQITDFDDEVVEGMLEYLYTGETICMTDRASELLQIAEKYDLTGLKADCEYAMTEKLSMENAAEILILAQTHNAPLLKLRAVDFINLNKEKLLKMKSFQDALKTLADSGALADLYVAQK